MESRENLELARQWLDRCLALHDNCINPAQPSPPLPTRIIDVGVEGCASVIKLVSSAGRKGPYITLSHVWGRQLNLITTTTSFDEWSNRIAVESLPRTFQDAVSIARHLSIRYVWIDSLCIIQDSSSDWSTESAKMGDYYMNSLFTIAAVSASDGSGGCFLQRDPLKVTPCPIGIGLPVSDISVGRAGTAFGFFRPTFGSDPSDSTDGFHRPPLWQRAWVVQERLLSTRLLQFSDVQMSWACRSENASERVPEGSSRYVGTTNEDRILRPVLVGLEDSPPHAGKGRGDDQTKDIPPAGHATTKNTEVYDAWYDLVMLYGKCNLTVASDIFPAISGIAKAISHASGDKYVAGLWKHDMHRGLLWTAPDSTASRRDLRHTRAPSWSWASLPATCTFYVRQLVQHGADTSCMEMEDFDMAVEEENPFGIVSSGRLKIRGPLKRAHPYDAECRGEEVFDNIRDAQPRNRETLFDLEQRRGVGHYNPDNLDRRYLSEVWCAPVMTEVWESPGDKQTQIHGRCLALIPMFAGSNVYMRVGAAWVKDFSWFRDCEPTSYYII